MSVPSQTGSTATGSVAVFEERPWWAPELQRQFREDPVAVRGCRSAADASRADVAVLQLGAAPAEVLHSLVRRMTAGCDRGVIVVAESELSDLEWGVRELGADAFVGEQIAGEDLARLCRRQLEKALEQTWLNRV
jgi:hypothetical protein